jgi:hypothetical protein
MRLLFHISIDLSIYIIFNWGNAPTGINFRYLYEITSCGCIFLDKDNINR